MKLRSPLFITASAVVLGISSLTGAELVVGGIKSHFENLDPKFAMPVQFEVDLIVSEKGKKILEVVDEDSELTKIVDSTGKDLTGKAGFSPFSHGSEDNSRRKIQIVTKNDTPAAGASWVKIEGTVRIDVASKTEEVTTGELELKKGTKFEINGQKIKVTEAQKPKWGNAKWEVVLESKQAFTKVAEWRLASAGGEVMKIKKGGVGWSGGFGKKTYNLTLQFEKKVEKGMLKADVYTDFEQLEVPIDIKVGMGR